MAWVQERGALALLRQERATTGRITSVQAACTWRHETGEKKRGGRPATTRNTKERDSSNHLHRRCHDRRALLLPCSRRRPPSSTSTRSRGLARGRDGRARWNAAPRGHCGGDKERGWTLFCAVTSGSGRSRFIGTSQSRLLNWQAAPERVLLQGRGNRTRSSV